MIPTPDAPYHLIHANNLDALPQLPDNSVDSIVTDPPYGLRFMGRRWDYDVPSTALWKQCLRVLKPGGHLLAFAGTRTQHRMACRIEDAGFEVRDLIAWVYSNGFPKSMDVSKAIDRQRHDRTQVLQVTRWIASARDRAGLHNSDIDNAFGFKGMAGHWTTQAAQPAVPTLDQVPALLKLLRLTEDQVPTAIMQLLVQLNSQKGQPGPAWFEREVIDEDTSTHYADGGLGVPALGQQPHRKHYDITAPATEAARQWLGWGSTLKPALEPITVARKPLAGTLAENVTQHGTGALNIEACRIGPTSQPAHPDTSREGEPSAVRRYNRTGGTDFALTPGPRGGGPAGRWPANLIHDGSEDVVKLFPAEAGQAAPITTRNSDKTRNAFGAFTGSEDAHFAPHDVGGSAARFFYCAKASRSDRNEGCRGMPRGSLNWSSGEQNPGSFQSANTDRTSENHHPTVKPTALMAYLCRLITPPGGLVLDPFMGSGSTGKACMREGFRFIGIERDTDEHGQSLGYIAIATARISHAWKQAQHERAQGDLFGEDSA